MGDGLILHCEKCGERYPLMLGVGMGYPMEYDEIMEKLFKGEFGANLQKIVESTNNVVVDAKDYLYVCEKCGFFNVYNALDLYQVTNEDMIKESINEDKKWLNGWHFFKHDAKNFRILKRVKYACPKCKGRMKRYSEYDKIPELECPDCHEKLVKGGYICWD